MLKLLYWPLACLLMATAQGLLLPAIRRTPPGAEARRQSVALHGLLTVVYFGPLILVVCYAPHHITSASIISLVARLLLFDVAINLASGSPAFAVGSTAYFDRLLRRLAPERPERLRAVVWVVSLFVVGYLLVFPWKIQ